jgi:hypothetical protein
MRTDTSQHLTPNDDIRDDPASDASTGTRKAPKNQAHATTLSHESADGSRNDFHLFPWCHAYRTMADSQNYSKLFNRGRNFEIDSAKTGSSSRSLFAVDRGLVEQDLQEMDLFLKHKTDFFERLSYQKCSPRRRRDIVDGLAEEMKNVTLSAGQNSYMHKTYPKRRNTFIAAESVFRMFLPSDFDGPTVGKYWGALYRLLIVSIGHCHATQHFKLLTN